MHKKSNNYLLTQFFFMKNNNFIIPFVILLFLSITMSSQIVMTWNNDGTYSPSIPQSAILISGQAWGAGGGGGGAQAMLSATALGGGAGGGSFIYGEFPNAFDSCSVIVGRGGNGGGAAADGELGGFSKISFGESQIVANGGGAGGGISKSIAATESSSRGDYGLGGSFSSSSDIMNVSGIYGEDGGYGNFIYQSLVNKGIGGPGGAGAGVGGGVGGVSDINSNGSDGSVIGGGGSGGALYKAFGSDYRIGGNGAKGSAVLQFSLPRPDFNFSEASICEGESIMISISANYIANASYKLFFDGNEIASFNTQSFSFEPTTSGTYELIVYYPDFYSDADTVAMSAEYGISNDSIFVQANNQVSLNINPSPVISSFSTTDDYESQNIGTATAISDNESDLYYWSNGDVGSSINNLSAGEYCVTVVNTSGCSVSDCATVLGSNPISVDEETNDGDFDIYPNPSDGVFTIELNNMKNLKYYQIIDMNGSVLREEGLYEGQEQYEISTNLPSGSYIVRIITETKTYNKHLIIM